MSELLAVHVYRIAPAPSLLAASLLLGSLCASCQKRAPEANETSTAARGAALQQPAPAAQSATAEDSPAASPTTASLGQPAPAFTLNDLDGKAIRLSDFEGKTVVLEWFNPKCPFVKLSHTVGSLENLAERHADDGVVWLAINSAGEARQGHGVELNREAAKDFKMHYPVLLDERGSVGRAYGATNTPHMFIIDPQGILIYQGAIDNSPDGEGKSPTGGELVNYVEQALGELAAGKPVSTPSTQAYGCSVKYADG